MRVEVIVAIISGFAAIVAALIASVQAIRTSRLKAGADAKLEQIKAETNIAVESMKEARERRQKAFEIASVESVPIEAVLAQAWQDMQLIKDIISKLVSRARYDLDTALNDLQPPSSRLRDGYAKWGSSIPEQARKAWHAAKGNVSTFEQLMIVERKNGRSQLSPEVTEALRETRTFLTDYQMAIVGARQSIRESTIEHLLRVI